MKLKAKAPLSREQIQSLMAREEGALDLDPLRKRRNDQPLPNPGACPCATKENLNVTWRLNVHGPGRLWIAKCGQCGAEWSGLVDQEEDE